WIVADMLFVIQLADLLTRQETVETRMALFDHADCIDQIEMSGADRYPVQIEMEASLLPFLAGADMKLAGFAQDGAGNQPAQDVLPLEHDEALEPELGQRVHISLKIKADHFEMMLVKKLGLETEHPV